MVVRNVLLDADGVVQRVAGEGWRALVARHLGERTDEFVAAVDELEAPALRGTGEFPDGLERVLADFGVAVDAEDFYVGVWLVIEPLQDTLDLAASLRDLGLGVHLVTNQHPRRAAWMKQRLGYGAIFDEHFYSCDLGVAKPDPDYFRLVAERLGCPAPELLFVDDSHGNVRAAREVGLAAEQWHHDEGQAVLRERLARHGVLVQG